MPVLLHAPAPLDANQLHDTGKRRAVREQKLDGTRRDEVEIAVLDLRLVQLSYSYESRAISAFTSRSVNCNVMSIPPRLQAPASSRSRILFFRHVPAPEPR